MNIDNQGRILTKLRNTLAIHLGNVLEDVVTEKQQAGSDNDKMILQWSNNKIKMYDKYLYNIG